jgi:hypothetical protein
LIAAYVFCCRLLIDSFERRSPNPALDFIERAAVLEVSVA